MPDVRLLQLRQVPRTGVTSVCPDTVGGSEETVVMDIANLTIRLVGQQLTAS